MMNKYQLVRRCNSCNKVQSTHELSEESFLELKEEGLDIEKNEDTVSLSVILSSCLECKEKYFTPKKFERT